MKRGTATILSTKTDSPIKWMNGGKCKSWEKLSISIVISLKVNTKIPTTTITLIRLCLSFLIKKKLSSEKSFLCLLRFTSPREVKTLHLKEFNTWFLNAYRNASRSKERSWFPTSNWSEEVLVFRQHLTACKGNWYKTTLMGMGQRWKCLQQTKDQKEEFQAGWEQQLWHRWKYSTNGLSARKNMRSMELLKFKRDCDY